MNKVCLSGRLTKDAELRFAAGSGTAVTRFSLAVRRNIKDKNTGKYESDFINCISFGKQAETIAQYFQKGSQIAIVGHIQTGSYNAQDGSKRYTTDVLIESFEFVGNNNNQNNNNFNNNFGDDLTPVADDDMPF
ncbi:single-stranded DNA-binding protein [Clostridium thermobutyricum]|uniref:Single-stranded DNA-binding protein n=1 Tax=Clostridium thermobutyricum DSM 4928 TaxID=1121339 RepID=A0A1V4SWA5_9CLOT|nr:single-stranded DNA-binding protein [Clostridium thermobutyricum]OPX48482.1 single-stranded DNA-binding protein A [Clostridium thermobutyricum DSM 4928]